MKTIEIKGKQYVSVNERLKYFREKFAGYCLLSEIIELNEKRCVIKARLINENGVEVANGLAYEDAGSSYINKTSYLENCETSSWGRCLANFGIGIESDVASSDEILSAIKQDEQKQISLETKQQIEAIKTVDALEKYYHENKDKNSGKQKDFNKAISQRKEKLNE